MPLLPSLEAEAPSPGLIDLYASLESPKRSATRARSRWQRSSLAWRYSQCAGEMLVLAEALPIRGTEQAKAGDWPAAERDIAEGLALARTAGYPLAEARALHLAGAMALAQDREERGVECLDAALVICRRLVATPNVARLERLLMAAAPAARPLGGSA